MARVRQIHPGACLDEDVATMSLHARLAWAYLPCHADKDGRLKDSPFALKAAIMPADAVDMNAVLNELAERRHIVRYVGQDGRRYIQIRSFAAYQRPHQNEKASTIPPPAEVAPVVHEIPEESEALEPTVEECAPLEQACDPTEQALRSGSGIRNPEFGGIPPRDLTGRYTGYTLQLLWGRLRAELIGGLPWSTPSSRDGKAESFAAAIPAEALADVEATMRLALGKIRDGATGWTGEKMAKHSFSFACWMTGFDSLREEIHGKAPRLRGPPIIGREATDGTTLSRAIAEQHPRATSPSEETDPWNSPRF